MFFEAYRKFSHRVKLLIWLFSTHGTSAGLQLLGWPSRSYDRWFVHQSRLSPKALNLIQSHIEQLSWQPVISVFVQMGDGGSDEGIQTIESVLAQLYPYWQLCLLVKESSEALELQARLHRDYQHDPRIQVVDGRDMAADPLLAWSMVKGDYVTLITGGDELTCDALYALVRAINQHPEVGCLYTDEDQITPGGQHMAPCFKPDWSPDYAQACAYTGQLAVFRAERLRCELPHCLEGFGDGDAHTQSWNWVLCMAEQGHQIFHIPKVLYHRRVFSWSTMPETSPLKADWPGLRSRQHRSVLEHMLARSAYPGRVEMPHESGFLQVRRDLIDTPLISIVIPSAGQKTQIAGQAVCLLKQCVDSIQAQSTYRKFEIIVVDGGDISAGVWAAIAAPNLRSIHCQQPFNYSMRMNLGIAAARGEIVLMLNDDIEVLTPDWLERMLELAQQKDIGAVGAKLFFPDGRLQHVGILLLAGRPVHAFHQAPGDHPGYFASNIVNRNYLAVTAACLMMRKAVFDQVGGFDEGLPLNFNDVDLCLRVYQTGYRNVVTPHARLNHYESASRDAKWEIWELEALHARHKGRPYLQQDPFYNPNLALFGGSFELGTPPKGQLGFDP
ncbi:MAG: glycosyltransferase family 2 protein [Cyanobacteria bacterium P01_D01_bin.44]